MQVNRALSVLSIALALLCSNASADIIDLTTADAIATPTAAIGGVFRVEQIDPQSTGTGVIDPFLRIQASGNEQGYNTNANPEFDAKAGTWTHALLLANVPTVTIGSVSYRQFLLDVNQNSGGDNEILSLNQVQLFQSGADLGTGNDSFASLGSPTTPPVIAFGGGATEVFRMNNSLAGFTEILLDYALNDGSGSGDMFLYVRDDAFMAGAGAYVTMYSQFGAPPGGFGSNDGFEEWATIGQGTSLNHVPEPASVILLGSTLLGLCHFLRKRFAR